MAEGPFAKINAALKRRKAEAGGVDRKALDMDDDLRERREKERMARAREERLKMLGLK